MFSDLFIQTFGKEINLLLVLTGALVVSMIFVKIAHGLNILINCVKEMDATRKEKKSFL